MGKLDDDTYLHAGGMAALLRSTLPWLDRPWMAFLGPMEAFSWDEKSGLPAKWAGVQATAAPCLRTGSTQVGPFSFAKGAAFFLSSSLAALFARPDLVTAYEDPRHLPGSQQYWVGEMGRSTDRNASAAVAWEDVWLGYALSQMASARRVALVHMGPDLYQACKYLQTCSIRHFSLFSLTWYQCCCTPLA